VGSDSYISHPFDNSKSTKNPTFSGILSNAGFAPGFRITRRVYIDHSQKPCALRPLEVLAVK
jgi:hypothetical protein